MWGSKREEKKVEERERERKEERKSFSIQDQEYPIFWLQIFARKFQSF